MAERPRVYVDSNAFIYALEGEGEVAARGQALVTSLRSRAILGFTSELTLAEVLVRPARIRDYDLKRAYLSLFGRRRSIVDLLPVTRAILTQSVEYRAKVHPEKPDPTETRRNFLPDAIHVVTAIEARTDFFVAADARLRLPRGMALINPRTASLDTLLAAL